MLSDEKATAGVLKVSGVPASWRGEGEGNGAAVSDRGGVGREDADDDGQLVFRYRDKVVDEVDLREVGKVRKARTKKKEAPE